MITVDFQIIGGGGNKREFIEFLLKIANSRASFRVMGKNNQIISHEAEEIIILHKCFDIVHKICRKVSASISLRTLRNIYLFCNFVL